MKIFSNLTLFVLTSLTNTASTTIGKSRKLETTRALGQTRRFDRKLFDSSGTVGYIIVTFSSLKNYLRSTTKGLM